MLYFYAHKDFYFPGTMRYTFSLLLLFLSSLAFSGTLKGRITDARGEALPFATVFLKGTTIGTTANASGEFVLTGIPAGSHTAIAQYISFEQQAFAFSIGAEESITKNFSLREQNLSIKEVVVKSKDEDPAIRIMRQVIKKRSFHQKQIESFQTDIYLKGVLRTRDIPTKVLGQKLGDNKKEAADAMGVDTSGKGVVYLVEEDASYFAQGGRERTIIHSVRESGNPGGVGFSQLPSVISFYDNNIDLGEGLAPRGLISPVADGALGYYQYKLEGEFVENHQVIYQIAVKPRRLYEPLFNGKIFIAADDWAIHSLSLSTNNKQGIEFLDTLRIDQIYVPLRKDTWVIKSQLFYPAIKVLGFDVVGNFVTVYNNQKVNEPAPDSVFAGKIISSYDATANKKDTAYWLGNRPVPLEEDEMRNYQFQDSMLVVNNDPVRQDSLRRRGNRIKPMDLLLSGVTINGKAYKSRFTTNSLIFMTNYNTVEGLNISPKFWYQRQVDSSNLLKARAAFRYGFSNTHFNGMGRLSWLHRDKYWRGRMWEVGAEGGKYVFQFNPENPVSELLNTASTLLFAENYLKLYERWNYAIDYRHSRGNGLSWSAAVNYQDRMPLQNTTDYTWAKEADKHFTPNEPQVQDGTTGFEPHRALLVKAAIGFRPGVRYVQYPDYKSPSFGSWPTFTLSYVKGIPDVLESKTDFDKWRFTVDGDFRLRLLGSLDYRLSAGGFLNDNYVSLADRQHLYGNQFVFAGPYLKAFQMAPYYRYSNTEKLYGEAHVEYNMQGLLTNKIPLLRQARWFFILGTNSWYAGPNNWYSEAFVSVDNLGYKMLRFLRVDFVQSWDAWGRRNSGIRVGLRASGPVRIGVGSGESGEW